MNGWVRESENAAHTRRFYNLMQMRYCAYGAFVPAMLPALAVMPVKAVLPIAELLSHAWLTPCTHAEPADALIRLLKTFIE